MDEAVEGQGAESAERVESTADAAVEQIQATLGYRFAEPELLLRALTHSSFRNEAVDVPSDNERLEFLGDAVLELVMSDALFARFPERTEGALTQLRARVVNSRSLAHVARRLDLGAYLRLGRGEERTGGRERRSVLADGLEAVLGAVFLDSGFDQARRVIGPLFEPELADLEQLPRKDPKSRLQEWAQQHRQSTPRYRIVETRGPDHEMSFAAEVVIVGEVAGVGEGRSKKDAHQRAAADALGKLDTEPAE